MKELNTFRKFLAEEQINEDYFNEAKFTEYNNNELAAYVKNNPKDKEAEKELHKRAQGIKALSRTDEGFLDLKENVNPEVIKLLDKHTPEEVAGSWDDIKDEFAAPLDTEELAYEDEDVQEILYQTGLTTADLPTEYVEIPPTAIPGYKGFRGNLYLLPTDGTLGDSTGRNLIAKTFAKYVPGEGIYYRFTTDEMSR